MQSAMRFFFPQIYPDLSAKLKNCSYLFSMMIYFLDIPQARTEIQLPRDEEYFRWGSFKVATKHMTEQQSNGEVFGDFRSLSRSSGQACERSI